MKEGSNRYNKQLLLQQKRAMTAANIRKDGVENFTSFVTKNYAEAVIDTFNFKGSLKVANHSKAYRAMACIVVQRLKDKAAATGTLIREVEHKKGIKTTMKCSNCGSERVNVDAKRICFCNKCKQSLDRDLNAAINCYKLK